MKLVGFMLVLIAASCPAVRAQPALWFCQDDLPRLRETVQHGPEAEVWQYPPQVSPKPGATSCEAWRSVTTGWAKR